MVVFKDGEVKKKLPVGDSINYLREKQKKWKARRPKRECSETQLANLARGREIREKKRLEYRKQGEKQRGKVAVKPKDSYHYTDRKNYSSDLAKNKKRVRRAKEGTDLKRLKKRPDSMRGLSSDDEYQGEGGDSD